MAILLSALSISGLVKADFNDGVVALSMGQYDQALQTFLPLAETSDHAYAQYFLGRMYADGRGVEQDTTKASTWYRKAAEQGIADAQYRLGALYESGDGVPADMEYAYGWYSVAAHLGNPHGTSALDKIRGKLSEEELVEADKLSRDLIAKFGKTPRSAARQK